MPDHGRFKNLRWLDLLLRYLLKKSASRNKCKCSAGAKWIVDVESAKDARRPVSSLAHLPWFGTVSASLLFS